ncbi:MAG: hypothetical protein Q7U04_08705 [Bacteriovorax sp.]|nr:hypothetical protein [Bacteriovorax sp.]
MLNKLKKLNSFVNYLIVSLIITSFLAHSHFKSNNFSTHELLNSKYHGFLFSSHLNDHHDSNDTHENTSDEHVDHVHKHRHSENEEEHSHKHLNFLSSSEIVIHDITYILFHPLEKRAELYFDYSIRSYDSYILEVLKPPIRT